MPCTSKLRFDLQTAAILGNTVNYAPPASSPNACTGYLDIAVPAGKHKRLSVRLQTAAGTAKNRLTLKCDSVLP